MSRLVIPVASLARGWSAGTVAAFCLLGAMLTQAGCAKRPLRPNPSMTVYSSWSRGPNATDKVAADLGQCPYGHAMLKDIPILYGFPMFDGPEGDTLRQQIENHELTLGGCTVDPGSPKVSTECLECGFMYDQDSDSWFRSSEDPQSFQTAISDVVQSFQPVESDLWFYAQLRDADGSWEESVTFETHAKDEALVAYVTNWMAEHGLLAEPPREPASDVPWVRPESLSGPEWIDAAGLWRISVTKLSATTIDLHFSMPAKETGR